MYVLLEGPWTAAAMASLVLVAAVGTMSNKSRMQEFDRFTVDVIFDS